MSSLRLTAVAAATLAAACALAVPPRAGAATCGEGTYAYAGMGGRQLASGVAATIAPTAAPSVRDGHVDGWVGVGGVGLGPNGTDEWIQIGFTSVPNDSLSSIYYEIQRPGRHVLFRELRSNVGVGASAPVRRPRARGAAELVARLARRLARLCTRLPPGEPQPVDGAGRRRELGRHDERHVQHLRLLVRGRAGSRARTGTLEPVPQLPAVPGPELPAGAALGVELRRPQRHSARARLGRNHPVTRTGRPRGRPVLNRRGRCDYILQMPLVAFFSLIRAAAFATVTRTFVPLTQTIVVAAGGVRRPPLQGPSVAPSRSRIRAAWEST